MINSKKTYQKRFGVIKQMVAMLLLCAIFSVMAVQVFHHHGNCDAKHPRHKTSYQKNAENCSICEYLSGQKKHEHFVSDHTAQTYFQPKAEPILSTVSFPLYDKVAASVSSRGPPSIS